MHQWEISLSSPKYASGVPEAPFAASQPPQSPLEVSVTGLQKAFDGKPVLKGVNLAIRSGELLAIVGGSGCGKTVLLKLIMGHYPADAGQALRLIVDLVRFTISETNFNLSGESRTPHPLHPATRRHRRHPSGGGRHPTGPLMTQVRGKHCAGCHYRCGCDGQHSLPLTVPHVRARQPRRALAEKGRARPVVGIGPPPQHCCCLSHEAQKCAQ